MSVYTDQGTAAHLVLEACLRQIYELGSHVEATEYTGTTIDLPPDEDHAWLSPSGAKAWSSCPRSATLKRDYPPPKEGARSVTFTWEDAYAVQVCLDYVASRVAELEAEYGDVRVYAERRVSLYEFLKTTDCDGTSDVFIYAPKGHFGEHVDYKHGSGVFVSASDPQNDLYLLGTLARGDVNLDTARLTIVQPRCPSEVFIRSRDIEDIERWKENTIGWALEAVLMAKIMPEQANPSKEACRWCPGRGRSPDTGAPLCDAYVSRALQEAGVVSDGGVGSQDLWGEIRSYATLDPVQLTPAQIADICDGKDALIGALKAVEQYALSLLQGDAPPRELAARYEVGRGRQSRTFADGAVDGLGKIKIVDPDNGKLRKLKKLELYKEVMKSPAEMEKTLKGLKAGEVAMKAFARVIEVQEGSPTLKRKRVAGPSIPSAADTFAAIRDSIN